MGEPDRKGVVLSGRVITVTYKGRFNQNLDSVSLEDFYRAINRVQASPVRVEADEVTYNLAYNAPI